MSTPSEPRKPAGERRYPWLHPVVPAMVRAIDAEATVDLKRAVPAAVVALICFGVGQHFGGITRSSAARFGIFGVNVHLSSGVVAIVVLALAAVFVLTAVIATRSVGRELSRVIGARGGIEAGNAVRLVCFILGYAITLLGVLALLRVDLGNLLVGGAVTGVVVGIAAQQTLGNFFAGLVLLFARPYVPGQRVKIRSGALGGPLEGVITGSGLMYTTLDTAEGIIRIPNSGLLSSAIGPALEPTVQEGAVLPPGVAAADPPSPPVPAPDSQPQGGLGQPPPGTV